jgi:siroheme synthase (precorrin-2 oxidase/ferrochelatase)
MFDTSTIKIEISLNSKQHELATAIQKDIENSLNKYVSLEDIFKIAIIFNCNNINQKLAMIDNDYSTLTQKRVTAKPTDKQTTLKGIAPLKRNNKGGAY